MDNKNCSSSLNVSVLSNRWTILICECLFAWVIILLTPFFILTLPNKVKVVDCMASSQSDVISGLAENRPDGTAVVELHKDNSKDRPPSTSNAELTGSSYEVPMGKNSSNEILVEPVDEELLFAFHSAAQTTTTNKLIMNNSNRAQRCADCDHTTWIYHSVNLKKVQGYGFGIAVSGGRDNPHFKSGDPSIAISDVLRSGPAWGLLQINDRIVYVNGVNLENADHSTAIQIMKDSENLNVIVKRRIPFPVLEYDQRTLKFTLTKSRRKDDFGIVLGCKFFIKDITNRRLAEKDPGLKEGDVVLKINGENCDQMTLSEARRLLDRSKDRLSLVIQRDVPRGANWKWSSQATLYERIGGTDTPRQSPTPRHSPMVYVRNADHDASSARSHFPSRYHDRFSRPPSEDRTVSPKRQSTCSQQSFGSRGPSQNQYFYDDGASNANLHRGPFLQVAKARMRLSIVQPWISSCLLTRNLLCLQQCKNEPRLITFRKESGSVGVRVIGGNEVGIFVSAVQSDSPAAVRGVRPGDKILRVNNKSMLGVTREEAVLHLLGLQDHVELFLQYKKDEYERIRNQNIGDNFFIRTHFTYGKPENGELSFKKGDIFQVIDTLYGGTVGSWQAICVSSPSLASTRSDYVYPKGVIPNSSRAEQLAHAERSQSQSQVNAEMKSSTLLRRKVTMGKRSKSLTKSHWDEVVFSHGTVHFAAYERVQLRHPGFLRPVVIYGSLADVAREKLLRDFPLAFLSSQVENGNDESDSGKTNRIVRLNAIRDVMNKNKHCILDITPSSVEKLIYAQYCPIVIFVNVGNRTRLRDLRKRLAKTSAVKSSKKLFEQSQKIQKLYSHLFTAVIDATHEEKWFEVLRDLIAHLQSRRVWMSESKPSELLDDDFLFPMSNGRYGSVGGGDSDVDSIADEPRCDLSSKRDATVALTAVDVASRMDVPYADNSSSSSYAMASGTLRSPTKTHAHMCDRQSSGANVDMIASMYENRDNIVALMATMRRKPPPLARKPKPPPPPRIGSSTASLTSDVQCTSAVSVAPTAACNGSTTLMQTSFSAATHADNSRLLTKIDEREFVPYSPRYGRPVADCGLYNVKQILEGTMDNYDSGISAPTASSRLMHSSSSALGHPMTGKPNLTESMSLSYYENTERARLDYSASLGLNSHGAAWQNYEHPSSYVSAHSNNSQFQHFFDGHRVCPVSPTSSGSMAATMRSVNGGIYGSRSSHDSYAQHVSEGYLLAGNGSKRPPMVPHRSPVPPPAPRSTYTPSTPRHSQSVPPSMSSCGSRILNSEDEDQQQHQHQFGRINSPSLGRNQPQPIPLARTSLTKAHTTTASAAAGTRMSDTSSGHLPKSDAGAAVGSELQPNNINRAAAVRRDEALDMSSGAAVKSKNNNGNNNSDDGGNEFQTQTCTKQVAGGGGGGDDDHRDDDHNGHPVSDVSGSKKKQQCSSSFFEEENELGTIASDADLFVCRSSASATVDHSGATLQLQDAGIRLIIPQAALSSPVELFVQLMTRELEPRTSNSAFPSDAGASSFKEKNRFVIVAGPSGLKFSVPVELCLPKSALNDGKQWFLAFKSSKSADYFGQRRCLNLLDSCAFTKKNVDPDQVAFSISHF
ncbi:Tight junction protein ZO-1 [Trichinella pseudospiralis]|uniref:Tight junction protein ZO-1 n=1 Tax=Trichinella pseudospiralis TaxID=6337 RepID=A0A0V1IDC3_TRIPS|nr:Tight junction protein ZO-1 [Trichinella pseudospiralis]